MHHVVATGRKTTAAAKIVYLWGGRNASQISVVANSLKHLETIRSNAITRNRKPPRPRRRPWWTRHSQGRQPHDQRRGSSCHHGQERLGQEHARPSAGGAGS